MKKKPNRDWSIAWGVWLFLLLVTVFFWPNVWAGRVVLLLFVVLEGWSAALRRRGGDTLSEFMQWIDSFAGEKAKWWQSWSALVTGLLLMISWQAAWVAAYGSDGPWSRPVLGVLAFETVFFWNLYHWLHARNYG